MYCGSCKSPLVEEVKDGNRYRLEFETIEPVIAEAMERKRDKTVWANLNDSAWNALNWIPVNRESNVKSDIEEQYKRLTQWAQTHEQPIRNVRLLRSCASWEVSQLTRSGKRRFSRLS